MRKENIGLVMIKPDTILDLMCIPKELRVKHREIFYDFNSDSFHLKLSHPSFPQSEDGDLIPKVDILLLRKCFGCDRPIFEFNIK